MKPTDNKFKEAMSGKSTDELEGILLMRNEYQPEAIQAAELELEKRIIIQEKEGIKLEDGDDYLFLNKIKSLSDSDLLLLFNKSYFSLQSHETPILNTELKIRNIEPKVWYYSSGNEKRGPYTSSDMKELANNGDLDFYDFVWRNGLESWIEAKDVKGLFIAKSMPPRIHKQTPKFINQKKINAGVIFSALTLFAVAIGWLLYGYFQVEIAYETGVSEIAGIGVWNILVSVACVGIGIGVLMMKKWGYNWGLGTALINVLWFGNMVLFESASIFGILMLSLYLITASILYSNKRAFENSIGAISI